MEDLKLKPCPFCGNTKLKIESKSVKVGYTCDEKRIERTTYSVRCNVCHARGGAVGGKTIANFRFALSEFELPSWATTDVKIRQQAIEAWNRRVDNV